MIQISKINERKNNFESITLEAYYIGKKKKHVNAQERDQTFIKYRCFDGVCTGLHASIKLTGRLIFNIYK